MTRLRSSLRPETRRLRSTEVQKSTRTTSRSCRDAEAKNNHSSTTPSKKGAPSTPVKKVTSDSPSPSKKLRSISSASKRNGKSFRAPSPTPSSTSSSSYSVQPNGSSLSSEDRLPILDTCALKPVFMTPNLDNNDQQPQLFGYETHYANLSLLLKNCVENGDSNCALICGGRGSGKTTLVNSTIRKFLTGHELSSKHDKLKPYVKLIRLNGYVHLNDVHTLKLIASTLELRLEGTDTMLYEIPTIMEQIKKLLKSDPRLRIIIILDEFDVFCRRQQTLLYNLFDVSQQTGSICTLCLTTRLDCLELLEKRVKSRMSQRLIHLTCPASDLNEYLDLAKKLLNQRHLTEAQRQKFRAQFSLNTSILGLKKSIIDSMMTNDAISPIAGLPPEMDPKLKCLFSLSVVEMSVLLMAVQYCKDKNKDLFTCIAIMENIPRLPAQYVVNKGVLYKALYQLSQMRLIIPLQSSNKPAMVLSEWTQFMIGIDETLLNETLDKNPSLLPMNVRHSLSLPS